jgi:hypothetical protein
MGDSLQKDSQTPQSRGLGDSYMTTADATRKTTKATLRTAPIIVLALVGQVYGAGVWATKPVANKLAIMPQRLANGRGYVSIEQAEAIAEELSQCIKANRAMPPAPPSYDPMFLDELAKVFAEAAPPAAERHTLETD